MIRNRASRTWESLGMAIFCLALAGPAGAVDEPVASADGAQADKTAQKRQIPPAEERAQRLTDRMKEKLGLTEEQASKIAEINLRTAKQNDAAFGASGADRRESLRQVRAANEQRDKEFKKILTGEQWKQYEQMREEMKEEVRAKARE